MALFLSRAVNKRNAHERARRSPLRSRVFVLCHTDYSSSRPEVGGPAIAWYIFREEQLYVRSMCERYLPTVLESGDVTAVKIKRDPSRFSIDRFFVG